MASLTTRVPLTEEDLLRLERTSDAAMLSASETIAETVEELSDTAEAARLALIEVEAKHAAAIAACVAETAAAFEVGNEAAALRAAWVASQSAQAIAARVPPGHEGPAAAAASRAAGRVAKGVEERAAFDRRSAKRAATAAIADAGRVAATVEQAAAATELTSYTEGRALARIAFDTSVQVAINEN